MAFSENNIERLLEQAEAADVFHKAVVGFILPDGSTRIIPFNTPEDTVFDIASLTKVCPTSTLALSYILEGKLSVDTKSSTTSRNYRQTTAKTSAFSTCSRTAWIIACR